MSGVSKANIAPAWVQFTVLPQSGKQPANATTTNSPLIPGPSAQAGGQPVATTASWHVGTQQRPLLQLLQQLQSLPETFAPTLLASLPGAANGLTSIAKLLLQLDRNRQGSLATSQPGSATTGRSLLASIFPKNVWQNAWQSLSPQAQTEWLSNEQLWSRNNPALLQSADSKVWLMYNLPWWQQGMQNQMLFFLQRGKRQRHESRTKTDPEQSERRFVMELQFSGIGPIQIDCMLNPPKRRLLIVVRSERPLPRDLQQELKSSYLAILAAQNWQATINFLVIPGYQPPLAPDVATDILI